MPDPGASEQHAPPETVGTISELYLGNILYALERCALSIENDGQPADAAFYRGIARKLAEAHGRAKRRGASDPA